MKSKAEIYTSILKRALKYVDEEKKKEMLNILLREYTENHLYIEMLESELEGPEFHRSSTPRPAGSFSSGV